jgi:UDP-glucuronate 4-epimerase
MSVAKKIVVTGGAGFIGSHLIDQLLKLGHQVICVDNFDPFYRESIKQGNIEKALTDSNFTLVKCDIRNQSEIEKCFADNKIDLVIHLAAKAGVRPSIEDPKNYFDVNVTGTLILLEAMRKYGVNKMLFASSSSVYGNNKKVPFAETDNVDLPISPYAASKKAGELLCHTYHHLFNFDIFCFRFFTVYGPRQRPDLAIHKFTDYILNNRQITVFGDGSSSRDYTFVNDIIDGLIKSIEKLHGYEIINLGESKPVSLNKMITTIESSLNKTANKKQLPMQPGDVDITYADVSKAKELIGYSPSTEFEDGIREFIKWKKNNLKYSDTEAKNTNHTSKI